MEYGNRTPAVWTEQEHFSVSEKGSIKPSGDAYDGRPCFITLQAAEHILANQASFKKAIELAKTRELNKVATKEITKLRVLMIKQGLTPEQANRAVDDILKNAKGA